MYKWQLLKEEFAKFLPNHLQFTMPSLQNLWFINESELSNGFYLSKTWKSRAKCLVLYKKISFKLACLPFQPVRSTSILTYGIILYGQLPYRQTNRKWKCPKWLLDESILKSRVGWLIATGVQFKSLSTYINIPCKMFIPI